MIGLEMKNCNTILTEKLQKYHHYWLGESINMNFLHGKHATSWWKKNDITSYVCIFSFRKSFWKTNKNDWRSKKKQIKALENHRKHLAVSDELIKKDLNND